MQTTPCYEVFTVHFFMSKVNYYCQTQKTVNTWKISGMLIVYWPITIKFRTCEQTSKPQTNYRCCLWFSYLAPYWLISRNTITFHKYFWCSRFCEFHSKQIQTIMTLYKVILYWTGFQNIYFETFDSDYFMVEVKLISYTCITIQSL